MAESKKFVLIDQSLRDVGSHHYEFAFHLLQQLDALGYEIVLATHIDFVPPSRLPENWEVFPVFEHDVYENWTYMIVSAPTEKSGPPNAGFLERSRSKRARRQRLQAFARSCSQLFSSTTIRNGDQVFLATATEFDLVAVLEYLRSDPRTTGTDWHLQFQFNIFYGREPDYDEQLQRLQRWREELHGLLHTVQGRRLYFYTTNQPLARQLDRLGIAVFQYLPYPVAPSFFHTSTAQSIDDERLPTKEPLSLRRHYRWSTVTFNGTDVTDKVAPQPSASPRIPHPPLRLTSAGLLRGEKGLDFIPQLVKALWPEFLSTGVVQLILQTDPTTAGISLPEAQQSTDLPHPPIIYETHPLPEENYAQLIRNSDIGLLLYDHHRYYARRSGVLLEMLCAGVPVIVPAGCWLADQITEPNYQYLDRISWDPQVIASEGPPDAKKHRSRNELKLIDDNELIFGGREDFVAYELPLPTNASDLLVSFDWMFPRLPGTYVLLAIRQWDAQHTEIDQFTTVVSQRSATGPVRALFHLSAHAHHVEVFWANAYANGHVTVANVEHRFLSPSTFPGGHRPAGKVGLIAAEREHVPDLLQDMVYNIEHYRSAAETFSKTVQREHSYRQFAAQLLAQPRSAK